MLRLTFIIAMAVVATPAVADDTFRYYLSGSSLTEYCRSYLQQRRQADTASSVQGAYEAGFCQGAVYSVLDGRAFLPPEENAYAPLFCPPQGYNANDAVEIVAQYLDENPGERAQPGFALIRKALSNTWPC